MLPTSTVRTVFTVCSLLLATTTFAAPIVLDGGFDDWSAVPVSVTDTAGDGGNGVDFGRVWATNDHRFFFLRFETGIEVQGDEQQSIRLYLDTDDDPSTGESYAGIGADLVWDFGQRDGSFRGSSIEHPDVGLLLAPTVSNTEFEIALRLDAEVGGQPVFPSSQVKLALRDTSGGDTVPDAGALTARIEATAADDPALGLDRLAADDVRVAAYNVRNNGLFDRGGTEQAYERLLGAIDADVWVFNELWDHDAAETASRVASLLPAGDGLSWDAVKRDSGNVVVSRWPILDSWEVFPGNRLTAALIDLDPVDAEGDLLVIAAHFSCCTADQQRQEQADALIAFVRDAQTPGGDIDLPESTPIVAAGDFNLVGWRQQLDTILTGDIQDEGRFGPDHAPDWDGSDFDLRRSTHTDQRVGYTWRNDFSSFYPGILDFVFVTESVAPVTKHFIVDTRTMRPTTLSTYGLQSGDTGTASDHASRVTDLRLATSTSAPATGRVRLHPNVPNPFNPSTSIAFELAASGPVVLDVVDVSGRRVTTLVDGVRDAGLHRVRWDGRDAAGRAVASGTYLLRLRADGTTITRKATLVE